MSHTRKITLAIAAAAAFGTCAALLAQDQSAPPPPPPQAGAPMGQMGPGGPHGGGGDMHRMAAELNLSPEQRQQVKSIMETRRQKADAIRANTALSPEQSHEQMKMLHEGSNAQIRALLNDDQKQKFDAMQAEHHMGKHRPMPPPPGGDAPPPPQQQ